jgi:hypothetical protein
VCWPNLLKKKGYSAMSKDNTPKKPSLVHELNHEKRHDRHIIWDEKAITEHSELRGTRMKVS